MFPYVFVLALALILAALVIAPRLTARRHRARQVPIPANITAKVDEIMAASRARFGHGALSMHGNAVIDKLEQERKRQFEFIDNLTAEAEKAGRDLVPAERDNIKAAHERVQAIDEQLKPLRDFEALRGADSDTAGRYQPQPRDDQRDDQGGDRDRLGTRTNEREYKYRSVGEFLADAYKASPGARRGGTMALETGARDAAADRLRSHGLTVEGGALLRAAAPHNTTAEVPGLLPHTIVGEIMSDVDAARPFITSIGAKDLGGIPGLTFERPTVTQHVEVAKQTAEKATVANRQFEVDGVPFAKSTYGGWANVSRQSIDWTSPGVWDALMTDFIEQYGIETEDDAADAFATSVTQTQQLTTSANIAAVELKELLVALYAAAGKSYKGSGRLPDTIWASLDWWAVLGPVMDHLKATTAGDGGGDSSMQAFTGNLLRTNRVVVPSFPDETLIVGTRSRTEVYEDRFGFLSVVQPKVFGVELAYGGYMASGTVKPLAFTKITKKTA